MDGDWVRIKVLAECHGTSDDVETLYRMAEEHQRLRELEARINMPEVGDFMRGVQLEAAHQQERWGAEHDAGKSDADWFWLLGYLGGKALRPGIEPEKKRHHIVSLGAACLNWFRHAQKEAGRGE